MSRWKLFSFLSLLSYSLVAHSAYAENNLLAVGSFNNAYFISTPLIATSSTQGKTWTYQIDLAAKTQLPVDFETGYFTSTNCNDSFCIAAGSYKDHPLHSKPLIAVSSDKGNSWAYIATQPSDYADHLDVWGNITTSCNNQLCAVAAGYLNKENRWLPFLAISQDKGQTWAYPSSATSHLPQTPINIFTHIHCNNDDLCIATLRSGDSISTTNHIAIGIHQGTDWSYTLLSPLLGNEIALQDAKCYQTFCVAVGVNDPGRKKEPVILISRNKGSSWTRVPIIMKQGVFNQVQCDGNTCVAVGTMIKDRAVSPLVAFSKNAGLTWNYPDSIRTQLPHVFRSNNENILRAVTCQENVCIAVGDSFEAQSETTNSGFLIAISKDHGMNWSYADVNAITPFDYRSFGQIESISCHANTCIATGKYSSDNDYKPRPYLALSVDNGSTWSLPSTITSELPKNFVYGSFFASSGEYH